MIVNLFYTLKAIRVEIQYTSDNVMLFMCFRFLIAKTSNFDERQHFPTLGLMSMMSNMLRSF